MEEATSYTQIVNAIQRMGLADSGICLHSSLKSFGYVEGGSDTIIKAFLDLGCTLVVPTFTYHNEVSPPANRQIPQNGFDYSTPLDTKHVRAYDKERIMISKEMGAIPARLLELDDHVRGNHPLNSFSAIGSLAKKLIDNNNHLNVYGPLKNLYDHPLAYVVLMGVDLTKATTIHLAEEMAGRRLFRRWAKNLDGSQQEVAVGSCSDGFNNFSPWVQEIELSISVGYSRWRVFPFKEFVDIIVDAIVQNPEMTHCPNTHCLRCNDAVKGGPLL